jgi:hypothetical protein
MGFLSSEECVFYQILMGKKHISRGTAVLAAISRIKLPIGGAIVVARRKTQGAGHAVYFSRSALKFEEGADGRFIQVHFEAREPECGPIFLISEHGMEAEGPKYPRPIPRLGYASLAFEPFFVSPGGRAKGCFGREDRAKAPAAACHRRQGLDAQTQEAARTAEGGIGRVVKRVPLEDAAVGDSAEACEGAEERGRIGDTQFDFGFAIGAAARRHARV